MRTTKPNEQAGSSQPVDPTEIGVQESARAEHLYQRHSRANHVRTDRLFVRLMIGQWAAGIALALWISPRTWSGSASATHIHVWAAVGLGGLIAGLPVFLATRYPGTILSRHVIAVGQCLASALLIHLTGGRIETHFHIFGSLAFLAFYRDWKVLVTASTVVAIDHLVRGTFWPQSVFGVLTSSHWRWMEHAAWVVFEDIFLVRSCLMGTVEMREIASRRAHLEAMKAGVEATVLARTEQLLRTNDVLESEAEERRKAEKDRDRLNEELVNAQKLEAVGQLAAGIAHEINTPTQYVGDNTTFLQESFQELMPVLEKARQIAALEEADGLSDEMLAELAEVLEESDVEYLMEEIPKAIDQSIEGVQRVSKIVQAMKEFSHPGADDMTCIDLNRAIESTVTVASNEWKYVAELETRFDEDLPDVPCLPGELNQVVLNMIVNASHAIADVVGADSGEKGTITIGTRCDGDWIEIRIADTGSGIPPEARDRIFDPFFTTKEVGKGTGQGLSIAHGVIVKKHAGTLDFETEMGEGTTFIIRLPREQVVQPEEAVAV